MLTILAYIVIIIHYVLIVLISLICCMRCDAFRLMLTIMAYIGIIIHHVLIVLIYTYHPELNNDVFTCIYHIPLDIDGCSL